MNKPSVGYGWFLEGVKAFSVAQDPVVEKFCLEDFMCPSGQAWGMPLSLPCPGGCGSQHSLVKSGDD